MTGWSDVLEAMHLAPRGVRTVRLVVEQRWGGVVTPSRPPPVARSGGDGSTIIATSSTTFQVSLVSGPVDPGATQPGDLPSWRTELWYDTEDRRYRVVRPMGSWTLVDREHRWSDMGDGRVLSVDVGAQPDQEILLLLVNPEVLLGWFRFDAQTSGSTLNRSTHRIGGTRRRLPMDAMLDMVLPGETVDATVDAESGVLFDLSLRSGEQSTFSLNVVECGFDDFDPDVVLRYEPAPGTRVVTPEELRDEHRQRFGRGAPLDVGRRPPLADTVMPVGPPPDDAEAAMAAIRHAVEHLTDIDDEDRCPNIQGGENLADCVRQTRQSPFVDDDGASFECQEIAFIRDDEAVVRFRVLVPKAPLGGIDTEGRALLVHGRWVIDRRTVCGLFGMAGVTCPPPPTT